MTFEIINLQHTKTNYKWGGYTMHGHCWHYKQILSVKGIPSCMQCLTGVGIAAEMLNFQLVFTERKDHHR